MKHLRLIILPLLLLFATDVRAEANSLEYKIKAVCLFNFAKYVQWPTKVFKAADQPIQVCTLGDSPFGDIFESNDAPKEAQGHPLKFVQLSESVSKEEVKGCQILYWLEKYEDKVSALMPTLQENSVLTVADKDSKQALISFVNEKDGDQEKVRFKINRKGAEALGLQMSSQLLKLAISSDE